MYNKYRTTTTMKTNKEIARINTVIQLNEVNPFKTNFIYVRHSYLLFLFAFFISLFSVIISRVLTSNYHKNNWTESIWQFIFDMFYRISFSMVATCGWTLYNSNKIKCIKNLGVSSLMAIDGIVSLIHWGCQYSNHSTLRWDIEHITTFDKILARTRYCIFASILLFYYFYYYQDLKNIRTNWTARKTISLCYMMVGSINTFITYGEGYNSLYIFGFQILFFMSMVIYDILRHAQFKQSHTHMGMLIPSIVYISYYLPRTFLFIFSLMNTYTMKIIIFMAWELLLIIMGLVIDKILNMTLTPEIKPILHFPIIFAIDFYMEFIFLDKEFFTLPFFGLFAIKFIFEIFNDVGVINFIEHKIYNMCNNNDTTINDLKIIKNFTVQSELNFFSERLALFVLVGFIFIDYILDVIGFHATNQKIEKNVKLHILFGYSFLFIMSLVSNIITTHIRSKVYNYYNQKLKDSIDVRQEIELDVIEEGDEKKIVISFGEQQLSDLERDEIFNTKFELTNWRIGYSFLFFILSALIMNGIESSPLYQ